MSDDDSIIVRCECGQRCRVVVGAVGAHCPKCDRCLDRKVVAQIVSEMAEEWARQEEIEASRPRMPPRSASRLN
jgi:hypothetical protein